MQLIFTVNNQHLLVGGREIKLAPGCENSE